MEKRIVPTSPDEAHYLVRRLTSQLLRSKHILKTAGEVLALAGYTSQQARLILKGAYIYTHPLGIPPIGKHETPIAFQKRFQEAERARFAAIRGPIQKYM